MKFTAFFKSATSFRPYPYQEHFAEAEELPHLVQVPTAAGKTATAILGWLWRRLQSDFETPRRLVYCLPMRVLVEQSANAAREWLERLGLREAVGVHVLMGGVDREKWFLHPEKPAVLIGTQDMLLSRALNRGYAESRFHWPIDFGLVSNDCLWVFDEPQLMGNGVSTSAQLAGLRHSLGTFGNCQSVWMSATLEPHWLDTIDFRGKFTTPPLELSEDDYDERLPLHKRMTADKELELLDAAWSKDMKLVAKAAIAAHKKLTQTLVIVNTVERAKTLYDALQKQKPRQEKLLLIHSRYRPAERQILNAELQKKGDACVDRIIVATQVVEAGVDISARTLITELAPWPSLVQRMGRCNRTGDDGPGRVLWIDVPDKDAAPYDPENMGEARGFLKKLKGKDVSPRALDIFKRKNKIELQFEHQHVIRRRDLIDLFDTTPDLSGNDIDIQRFVRSDDQSVSVQLFWRDFKGIPSSDVKARREELCAAPLHEVRGFLEQRRDKGHFGYVWDHLDREWSKLDLRQLRPGAIVLLPSSAGGYSHLLGWEPKIANAVEEVPQTLIEATDEEAMDADPNSITAQKKYTIAQHTANVLRELTSILLQVGDLSKEYGPWLERSALWHDVGKGHPVFQNGLRALNDELSPHELWAKSGKDGRLRFGRKRFRHELVSALAALQQGLPFEIAYLIASHHGKVRLSIRSFPDERPLPDKNRAMLVRERFNREPLYAAGLWDGDEFGPVTISDSETCPATIIDLSPMQPGGERSWTAQALALRDRLGPFRLAYLEALLRAADLRASQKEKAETSHA